MRYNAYIIDKKYKKNDVLLLNNSKFVDFDDHIYPIELEINLKFSVEYFVDHCLSFCNFVAHCMFLFFYLRLLVTIW